jgi:hypothetical protein
MKWAMNQLFWIRSISYNCSITNDLKYLFHYATKSMFTSLLFCIPHQKYFSRGDKYSMQIKRYMKNLKLGRSLCWNWLAIWWLSNNLWNCLQGSNRLNKLKLQFVKSYILLLIFLQTHNISIFLIMIDNFNSIRILHL